MSLPLNIVVVEDHAALRDATVAVLRQQGHQVLGLSCAEDVDDQVLGDRADVFLLDLNLPREDGISLSRRLRAAHPEAGIVMMTARSGQDAMAQGYESGADIYLTKPVDPGLLLSALSALARRFQAGRQGGEYRIDLTGLYLQGPVGQIDLQDNEARVLMAFARTPGQRLENWQLLEIMGQEALSKGSLEVRIVRLRKKLQAAGAPQGAIKAIRLWGYQLCLPVDVR